jgi:hypothetical protein
MSDELCTTSGGPMIRLQVYVFMSHTRMVLSREPVIILNLEEVSLNLAFALYTAYSSNWTQ